MPPTFGPRVTRLGALLLAAVATFGVATPRARVTARERVGRAVAIRLASPRINDRLGWVAPDPRSATAGVSGVPSPTVTPSRDVLATFVGESPVRAYAAGAAACVVPTDGDGPRCDAAAHRFRTFGRPPPQA